MRSSLSYFHSSFAVTGLGLAAAFWLGGAENGLKFLFIAAVLSVLEVSLSFDNAVVNATVLKDMDEKWRHRFLTWGMLIAVFGMRIIFPVAIVAIVASLNPWDAIVLSASQPKEYERIITSSHVAISGFGGAFLMMVFLKFFLDREKDVHWVHVIEEPLTKLGKMQAVEIAVCLLAIYIISTYLEAATQLEFLTSAIAGLITYIVVDGFSGLMEDSNEHQHAADGTLIVARSGLASFMYLEVLDASFSFDGVIGAFALSNNIFIIAIGLGIGAMFVRSMTIYLVEKGTLEQFRYLEHGAFYAIGALATIMFLNTFEHIPEVITGLIGACFIGLALWSSVRYNRANPRHKEA